MKTLAEEWDLPFPYLWDESQEVAAAYGAERTPEIFVFDEDMRLRYHGAPDDNRDETQVTEHYLRDALDAVLAGKDPPLRDSTPVGRTIQWHQRLATRDGARPARCAGQAVLPDGAPENGDCLIDGGVAPASPRRAVLPVKVALAGGGAGLSGG